MKKLLVYLLILEGLVTLTFYLPQAVNAESQEGISQTATITLDTCPLAGTLEEKLQLTIN